MKDLEVLSRLPEVPQSEAGGCRWALRWQRPCPAWGAREFWPTSSGPLLVVVNTVSLEHSFVHLFTIVHGCSCTEKAELSGVTETLWSTKPKYLLSDSFQK